MRNLPKIVDTLTTFLVVCCIAPASLMAQAGTQPESQELAKKLANPVSDLVSVPFQYNWENGIGPDDDLRTILNIQPVVPFSLSENWNVIGRWIAPYVSQPVFLGSTSGFSDIVFSMFFSPAKTSSLVWGVGPVLTLPTTTDPTLGSGKWSAGPTAVVLKISGPWVYGMLANQLWSFAATSDKDRSDVNQGFFQPFLSYCWPSGITFTLQSETTANWHASKDSDIWTVPINVAMSKLTKFGPFPFSIQVGAGAYVAAPDSGPEWKLRAAFVLLLPRS